MSELPTLYVDRDTLNDLRSSDRLHAFVAAGVVAREVAYVPASRLDAAIARAERAETFIESLSTGRSSTANRCTGIARTDPEHGDIACMRLAGHEGEHVALSGDALAYDLAEALAKVEHLERELADAREEARAACTESSRTWAVLTGRDWQATRAIDSTITEAKRVVDDRDAARAQVAELSALLGEAREAVDRGWRFPDGMPEDWRPLFVRELLAKIDTALAAAKETT